MRIKLTVVHTEHGGDPRTYLLEKDTIVIGRAGTADLPLDDPDRVVSKQHAEIRRDGDVLRVHDLGSKNHTFVNGTRVTAAGALVDTGDVLRLGPFELTVEIDRSRLIADDLDRTVFGVAFDNPFAESAETVATALAELRRAYRALDYDHREDALQTALRDAIGTETDIQMLAALIDPSAHTPSPPLSPAEAPPRTPAPETVRADDQEDASPTADASLDELFGPPVSELEDEAEAAVAAQDPFAFPADVPPPAVAPFEPPAPQGTAVPDATLHALAEAVVRLISIPGRFRHEFLGHTVIHAPETAFLFDADAEALLRHLATDDDALHAERSAALADAVEDVLRHHQSLLEGYRAAARDGAAVLVNGLDPDALADQAEGGGLLQGGRDRAILDLIRQRCEMMRGEDFAAAERRVYRPAFSRGYLDSLAYAQAAPSPMP